MSMFIRQPHDKFFKRSMSDARVAKDFFNAHLPIDLLRRVDLNTLKLKKQSFIDDAFKATEADVVYSIKLDDTLAYFYLLCEHQSSIDETIAFRLLGYIVRIMELHLSQNPKSHLPVVYPLVIYNGEEPWDAPREIFGLFGEQKELAKQLFLQPYQLVDVQRLSDKELQERMWSGLVEFILKYRRWQDFGQYLETVFPWLNKIEIHEGSTFVSVVLNYITRNNNVDAADKELFIQKANQYLLEQLRGEAMTLAEMWQQEGVEKGVQQVALRLLKEGFEFDFIAKMTQLTEEDLQALKEQVH